MEWKYQRLTREVILRMASPEPNTGCWLWARQSNNGRGYGRLRYQGRNQQAHRVFYELFKGPIPSGCELDHKCRVTFCVNPDHLEPVPHKINVRRGVTGAVNTLRQRSKTHCPFGHAYEGHNLIVRPNGARLCRSCRNKRSREKQRKNSYASSDPLPRKTHCNRGHLLSGTNIIVRNNTRICLECRRIRDRKKYKKKRALKIMAHRGSK